MSKVFLLIVIVYSNQPPVTYHTAAKNAHDCYERAASIAKDVPPEGENIVKYMIGCSFEKPADKEPS